MSTPKGYSKAQSYIITDKDEPLPEKHDNDDNDDAIGNNEDNKESELEYRKAEIDRMEDEKSKMQNGSSQHQQQVQPPKPLPRASRTNSLSEEGAKDEPKPVARPRTTPSPGQVVTSVNPNVIGGYKV